MEQANKAGPRNWSQDRDSRQSYRENENKELSEFKQLLEENICLREALVEARKFITETPRQTFETALANGLMYRIDAALEKVERQ